MYLNSQPQPSPTGKNKRIRPIQWRLACLLALLSVGLVAGVAAAASDPDWTGTEPQNMSASDLNLARQPIIAAGSLGRMVVAWSDQRSEGAQRDIYAVVSDDNGYTWSATPETIAMTSDTSLLPDALVIGDRTFVTWVDGNPPTAIYEAERTASGTWEKRPVPSPVPLSAMWPRLASAAGELHVVFNAGSGNQPDILYAARPLTATAWPTATVVHTHTGTGSWYPALAVGPDEETLHVVWEERASLDTRAIMYVRGTMDDTGVNWTPPLTLSTGITLSLWPDIAADSSGNLHVVWGEQIGTGATERREQYVRYAHYDAAGDSWSIAGDLIDPDPVKVNELRPTDITPSLALLETQQAGGYNQVTVCVAWHGFRTDGQVEPAEEVLLSCSEDEGQSWTSPQNVSRSPGEDEISIAPSITFDAQERLHSVWEEHVGASVVHNYEIYYAHALNIIFLPLMMRN
jgi:hypothetical protein